jgi:hypothetical protein
VACKLLVIGYWLFSCLVEVAKLANDLEMLFARREKGYWLLVIGYFHA